MSFVAIKRLPPLMLQAVDVKPDFFFPASSVALVITLGIVTCILGPAGPR